MLLAGAASLLFVSCNSKTENTTMSDTTRVETKTNLSSTSFGKLPDGTEVSLFTLKNAKGMIMTVMNYGGIITSLTAPDKNGNFEDVVLGYDSLSGYLKSSPYFGALIGRYGIALAKGNFQLMERNISSPKTTMAIRCMVGRTVSINGSGILKSTL
jgi:aldose 1-epimerase